MPTLFKFNPENGWADTTQFPQKMPNQATARERLQVLHSQTRDYINSVASGWIPIGDACSYVSATSFSINSDWSGVLAIGDKIRLVQSGATKYFYVIGMSVSGSTTTVHLAQNSSFSLGNAAISSPCLSKAASPAGFPDWFHFAPTFAGGGSMTYHVDTLTSAQFKIIGNQFYVNVRLDGTASGTPNNQIFMQILDGASVSNQALSVSITTGAGEQPVSGTATFLNSNNLVTIMLYDGSNYPLTHGIALRISGFYQI